MPYARRTHRLNESVKKFAFSMSSEAASRMSRYTLVPLSADTFLRIIRREPIVINSEYENIGVDDFAFHKGITYGTIICDLDTHRPVDLLGDRTKSTLSDWLKNHTDIKIVTRDRSNAYLKAINDILPSAIQIADKWNLIKNMSNNLSEILKSKYTAGVTIENVTSGSLSSNELIKPTTVNDNIEIHNNYKTKVHKIVYFCFFKIGLIDYILLKEWSIMRKDVANEIKMKKEVELLNKSELARRLGCDRRTVYRYLEEQVAKPRGREYASILEDYKGTVIEKVDNYGAAAMAIFKFIQTKGYTGGYLTVNNFVKQHKNDETQKATIRFETSPGLQTQVDWKEKLTMISQSGEALEVNIFLIVLGYSRLKFIKLTSNRSQKTLFECMFEAFRYFQGIPKEILFDNMKTVVDRTASTFKNVSLNKTFKAFSQDSGFEPITCRPFRPKTKGRISSKVSGQANCI